MKKELFMLPCIAAVAIATFVGTKDWEPNKSETSSLLAQNVEALSQDEGEIVYNEIIKCMGQRCNISYTKIGKVSTIEYQYDSIDTKTKYDVWKCCSSSLNKDGDYQGNNSTVIFSEIDHELIPCSNS